MNFTFQTVPDVIFEDGASAKLGQYASQYMKRPIFLTDEGLIKAGLIAPAMESLKSKGLDTLLFSDVQADPPTRMVIKAFEAARAHGADGVIGFGGGSSMDTAKLVAALMGGEQTLEEMYGVDQITGDRAALILLPTTSGTGSEVTNVSIVTTEEDVKVGIVSKPLYADMAILDPSLTLGLPRHVTAATGIDAMVHAIEAYTNINRKNPVSDALAREALRLLSQNVVAACETPGDRNARANMLLGAMLAGQAFSNAPVGGVHGMAYPLGGLFHIPHGLSNALMLAPVLRFNAPNAAHQYAELAPSIGASAEGSEEARCHAFIDKLVEIMEATGVERRLSQVGISEGDLPRLAEDAIKSERVLRNNPRVITQADALQMYTDVL